MERKDLEYMLQVHINDLLNKWVFLRNTYHEIEYKHYFHRTQLSHVKYIDEVKQELFKKLGILSVFVFLTDYFYKIEVPGPYYHADKGLLILYHLVSGLSIKKMDKYIPYATFFKIYKCFYIKHEEDLKLWIKKINDQELFTNNVIRLIYAKLNNPIKLKNVTCFLDGYDSRVSYEDIKLDKKRLYSFKFENDGFRTQYIIDINGFIMYTSNTEFCNDFTDGKMFEKFKIENIIKTTDCLMVDGGYTLHLNTLIEKCNARGIEINLDSFCFPIRKEKNIDFTDNEENFNKQLGSFRSEIESFFYRYTNMFHRFNKNNVIRVTEKSIYNSQIKLCNILYNIKNAQEKYNIPISDNYLYSLWLNKGFRYKTRNEESEFTLEPKVYYRQELINNRNKFQDDILLDMFNKININDSLNNNAETDDISTDNSMNIDTNLVTEDIVYEVERIINHQKTKYKYKYLVKWKHYHELTWEDEDNFIEKDCIKEYWNNMEEQL